MSDFDNGLPQSTPATSNVDSTSAPTTQGAPSTSPVTTQPGSQVPATGTPDDRSNWVPPHRLREQRESYERQLQSAIAQREAQWKAQDEAYQRKIQALAGITPQNQSEEEVIKAQFAKLFPHLGGLTPEKIQQMEQMLQRAGDLESQNNHYWQSYGQQQKSKLVSLAETDLGPLSDAQKNQLVSSLVGYIKSDPSGQLEQEYSSNPNFVSDFYKVFSSSFIDPARRSQAAGTIQRAQVPVAQDTPSGQVRVGQPPPKPANADERVAQAWTRFNEVKNR